MWLPLFSVHYCNPIAGNQEQNFPILCCNKAQLSLLDSILIQFGVISIWALAADRLAWCQTDRLGDGGTRARATPKKLRWSEYECRLTQVQTETDRNWTGSSDEWYLESDYRFGLEVDCQLSDLLSVSLCYYCVCCSRWDVKQCWTKSRPRRAEGNDALIQKWCARERGRGLLWAAAPHELTQKYFVSLDLSIMNSCWFLLTMGLEIKLIQKWIENISFLCNSLL